MITNEAKAGVLTEALPYIKKYSGRTVVIKYGGSTMTDAALERSVMRDLVLLREIGVKVVLVHGGGPEITATLAKMKIETTFVNGLRATDKETMDVVQMVLAGKIAKKLVSLIESEGGSAIGISGVDGHMLEAKPVSAELGFVGAIAAVNTEPIEAILAAGAIPVISPTGFDKEGNFYNINADTVAARIAGELKATAFFNLTDAPGILRDKDDPATLIRVMSASEAPQFIKEGIIQGGMIPKVQCCVEAVRRGVGRVFILDGRTPHAVLVEMLSDEGIGTMFY